MEIFKYDIMQKQAIVWHKDIEWVDQLLNNP